jgi:hypothetical protein
MPSVDIIIARANSKVFVSLKKNPLPVGKLFFDCL